MIHGKHLQNSALCQLNLLFKTIFYTLLPCTFLIHSYQEATMKRGILSLDEETSNSILDVLPGDTIDQNILPLLDHQALFSFSRVSKKAHITATTLDQNRYHSQQKWLEQQPSTLNIDQGSAFFIKPYNEVVAFGQNHHGQLALGHKENVKTLTQIDFFKDIALKQIFVAQNQTFFITLDDKVYVCGKDLNIPTQIAFFNDKPLKHIFANYQRTYFITQEGQTYYNQNNQYIQIFKSTLIQKMDAGEAHTLVLTQNGQVYGQGHHVSLGMDRYNDGYTPITFFTNKPVKFISAGEFHSFFITDDDNVYCCGNNDYGQLGLGHTNVVNTPTLVNFFEDKPLKQIAASNQLTLFLGIDGKVYGCGRNGYGLGLNLGFSDQVTTPTQIAFFKDIPIKQIVAGRFHTFFLSVDGQVFGCGENSLAKACNAQEIDGNSVAFITSIIERPLNQVEFKENTDNEAKYSTAFSGKRRRLA